MKWNHLLIASGLVVASAVAGVTTYQWDRYPSMREAGLACELSTPSGFQYNEKTGKFFSDRHWCEHEEFSRQYLMFGQLDEEVKCVMMDPLPVSNCDTEEEKKRGWKWVKKDPRVVRRFKY